MSGFRDPSGSQHFKSTDVETVITGSDEIETYATGTNQRKGISIRALHKPVINLAAATQTLTESQSCEIFVGVVDAVFTLPAAADVAVGTNFTLVCGALSAGTGLSVSPVAADNIYGGGMVGTNDKDAINSGATDVVGDLLEVTCDGVDWLVTKQIGTWAEEA